MTMTKEQQEMQTMRETIARLEAERDAALLAKNNQIREITFHVTEDKGTIGAYGVQAQWPVALYVTQWQRLIPAATGQPIDPDSPLGKFITANSKYLALKDDSETVAKDKALLRKSEAHGVVKHPKNKAAA